MPLAPLSLFLPLSVQGKNIKNLRIRFPEKENLRESTMFDIVVSR